MSDRTSICGMDSRPTLHSLPQAQRLIGLHDVLELNALRFLTAVTELKRLNTVLVVDKSIGDEAPLDAEVRDIIASSLNTLYSAVSDVGARATQIAITRTTTNINNHDNDLDFAYLRRALIDIEGRFADELNFVRLFILSGDKADFYAGAERFLKPNTSNLYPGARFDCDEAARCLALGRPTASVFHSMRMIEVAVGSIARRLSIPDPIKPAERNWGSMLAKVKGAIDQNYPSHSRLPHSEGCFLEGVYVTLDAIKNPWRNATMHVESVYTEEEARHIFACTTTLLDKMAAGFDESGQQIETDQLALPSET